jgi:predicted CopG family antitoxin
MKTVTFDDEAYEILRGLKSGPGDSFSDVVKRHFGGAPQLEDSAGGWSDMTDGEVRRLRASTIAVFETTARKPGRTRRARR